jgi:hypothetical protein
VGGCCPQARGSVRLRSGLGREESGQSAHLGSRFAGSQMWSVKKRGESGVTQGLGPEHLEGLGLPQLSGSLREGQWGGDQRLGPGSVSCESGWRCPQGGWTRDSGV